MQPPQNSLQGEAHTAGRDSEAAADESQQYTCGLCQGRLGVPVSSQSDRQYCVDLLSKSDSQGTSGTHGHRSDVECTESVYEVPSGQCSASQGCPCHRVYVQSAHRELRVATALASHPGLARPRQSVT